jgi:hypothetical protein
MIVTCGIQTRGNAQMAEAQRPSTIHRPGGTIINLVGTTSFEAIMVIKEGQTNCDARFVTKLFHMQDFSKKTVL